MVIMESNMQGNFQIDACYRYVPVVGEEQDLPINSNLQCLLDSEGYISLGNILATYDAPINEEHAWALCYLSAKCLETHSLSSSTSSRGPTRHFKQIPDCMELIKICSRDGQVALSVDNIKEIDPNSSRFRGDSSPDGNRITESKLITKIALIIYQALDFGMRDDEERCLSSELVYVLDKMASSADHNENEDSSVENKSHFKETDVIRECLMHFESIRMPCEESADAFYQQICKNLVVDTLDFLKFLHVAERASQKLKCFCCGRDDFVRRNKVSGDFATNLKDDLKAVAKIWVRVVRELRRGVNLKRLDDASTPLGSHHKYEKTPYELLMEDIRSQKCKLKKVLPENVDKINKVKANLDLHDIIMEYIRSQPKLRKVSERKLKPAVQKDKDPYEELLKSIRQAHHLRPVASKNSTL